MTTREAPTGYPLWSTEDGRTGWVLGEHTEQGRWEARRSYASETGYETWGTPLRAKRVWIAQHQCDPIYDDGGCWCSAFDGPMNAIDEVPKGTPGAVSAWRLGE